MSHEATSPLIVPVNRSPWVHRGFTWWLERMVKKQFFAVRMAKGTREVLESIDTQRGPALVLMNHSSWWDPLIALWLTTHLSPQRLMMAPMEAAQLAKFNFFRKLGVFGLDPDNPASLDAMVEYVAAEFEREPRTAFWVTPQGTFADVRSEIRLRPGTAALAANLAQGGNTPPVVCLAIELGFWTDQRPELFLRLARCHTERPGLIGWQRAMTAAMRDNCAALAGLVMDRDPAGFDVLAGAHAARINPLFDLWNRVRRRPTHIEATDRRRPSHTVPHTTPPTHTNSHSSRPLAPPASRAGGLEGAA